MDPDLAAAKGLHSQMDQLRKEIMNKHKKVIKLCEYENKKTVSDKFNVDLQQLLNNFK